MRKCGVYTKHHVFHNLLFGVKAQMHKWYCHSSRSRRVCLYVKSTLHTFALAEKVVLVLIVFVYVFLYTFFSFARSSLKSALHFMRRKRNKPEETWRLGIEFDCVPHAIVFVLLLWTKAEWVFGFSSIVWFGLADTRNNWQTVGFDHCYRAVELSWKKRAGKNTCLSEMIFWFTWLQCALELYNIGAPKELKLGFWTEYRVY